MAFGCIGMPSIAKTSIGPTGIVGFVLGQSQKFGLKCIMLATGYLDEPKR